MYESSRMRDRHKNAFSSRHSPLEEPHAPSDKFSPTEQVVCGGGESFLGFRSYVVQGKLFNLLSITNIVFIKPF